jgi:hypothetical protein
MNLVVGEHGLSSGYILSFTSFIINLSHRKASSSSIEDMLEFLVAPRIISQILSL